MTVTSPDNKWLYAGNDVQTVFQYLARVYEASDLVVHLRDAGGVEVLQILDTDYSVDGVLEEEGGNVTFVVAPATGETAIIKIELPYTQELALPEAGPLPSGPLEIALDRLTKLILQLLEQLQRTPKFAVGSLVSEASLPDPESGKFLVGNSGGDGYDNAEIMAAGELVTTGLDVAGYVKNRADGTLDGGQSILAADLPEGIDPIKISDGSVSNADFAIEGYTDYSDLSEITGWANITTKKVFIKKVGKSVYVQFYIAGWSADNPVGTGALFTVPHALALGIEIKAVGHAYDDGVPDFCLITMAQSSQIVTLTYSKTDLGWTPATDNKLVRGQFFYETA